MVLRLRLALVLGSAAVLTACGSSAPSPESVVRAWSQELNAGDNDAAAKLFAPGAEVIQSGTTITLDTHAQAVAFNAALPCSGQIVSITTTGHLARATFRLGDRKASKCAGPGSKATAIFRVVKGKIVLWHQIGGTTPVPTGPTV